MKKNVLLLVVFVIVISSCAKHHVTAEILAISADFRAKEIIVKNENSNDAIKIASELTLTDKMIASITDNKPSKFYVATIDRTLYVVESSRRYNGKTGASLVEIQTSTCVGLLRRLANSRGYQNVFHYIVDSKDTTVVEMTVCFKNKECRSFKKH